MNRLELVQQIKFALSRLGDVNGHHEFEKICLAFARQRISANFLPATGPVGSGGDQGRDAETFWSHLPAEGAHQTSAGLARIGDDAVVLACTLQVTGLTSKIASDLTKITTAGPDVDRVAYFLNTPVPVGLRHDSIASAQSQFQVKLEIFDLEALSVHLADPDLFWVASEYLRIPTDAAPVIPTEEGLPDWYVEIRERWRQAGHTPATFGDLAEARVLVRAATFNAAAQPDLDFALELLGQLALSPSAEIQWRAEYEICVATYRGKGDFRSIEDRLLRLVGVAIEEQLDPMYLQDAAVLVSYGMGASLRSLSTTAVRGWRDLIDRLANHVALELAAPGTANRRALLLAVEAQLAFAVAYPENSADRLAAVESDEVTFGDDLPEGGVLPEVLSLVDRDRGMRALIELLEILPQAPMFPLQPLAQTFDLLTLSLLDHRLYEPVRAGLEAALAKASGETSAADRAFRRAFTLAGAGQYRSALVDAMAASRSYWHAHDVAGSAQSIIVEGDLLQVMGLHVAAKSRYLAAAWAAGSHIDDSVKAIAAEALLGAAMQDYYLGRWITALPEFLDGFAHHARFLSNASELDAHEYLEPATQAFVNMMAVAQSTQPLRDWIRDALDHAEGVVDWDSIPAASEATIDELVSRVAAAELPPPFSDLQPRWSVRWSSYGTNWSFEFRNDASIVRASERLISTLQLMLVALADSPIEWLPTTVRVEVGIRSTDEQGTSEEKPAGAEGGVELYVTVPIDESMIELDPRERMATLGDDAKTVAAALLATAFVSGENAYDILGERLLGPDGAFSAPAVRLYDDTARVIEPRWRSTPEPGLHDGLPIGLEIPVSSTILERPSGRSPLLDEATTREHIRERYRVTIDNLWRTLPRIVASPECRDVMSSLRAEGALDWQLLSAIFSLVGTHRVIEAGYDPENLAASAEIEAILRSPEAAEDGEIPLDTFDRLHMERALAGVAFTSLPSYGVHTHARFPDLPALRDLLDSRFEYSWIDEPHPNVFGWADWQQDQE